MQQPEEDKNNHANLISSAICILVLCLSICGFIGFGMIFAKNDRICIIEKYNQAVDNWETTGLNEMALSRFKIDYKNDTYDFDQVYTSFGDYYPYRDLCSKMGDPECEESSVLYHEVFLYPNEASSIINISNADINNTIFKESVNFQKELELEKKDMMCDGGSDEACIRACKQRSGEWNDNKETCIVSLYLTRLCLRLHYSNSSALWSLDSPSTLSLPSDSSFGCEMNDPTNYLNTINKTTWLPFIYSTVKPSNVTFQIRHVKDPYIVTGLLTNGCSTSTTVNADCFGRSKSEDLITAFILIILGCSGIFILLVLISIVKHKIEANEPIPSWLSLFSIIGTIVFNVVPDEPKIEVELPDVEQPMNNFLNNSTYKGTNNMTFSPMFPLADDLPIITKSPMPYVKDFNLTSSTTSMNAGMNNNILYTSYRGFEDGI